MRHNTVWPRVQLRLLLSVRMCLCIIAVALAGYTGERFRVFLGGDDPVRQLMRATVALVFTTVLVEIPALVVPLVHLARGSLTPALMTRMSAALAFLWAVAMGLCAGTLGFDVNLSEKHEEMAGLLAVIILQVHVQEVVGVHDTPADPVFKDYHALHAGLVIQYQTQGIRRTRTQCPTASNAWTASHRATRKECSPNLSTDTGSYCHNPI